MVRLPQQPLIQVPCTLVLAFIFFEVDVCFPNQLWHIQGRLLNAKLEYGSRAVKIVQASLKLRELDPRLAVGWIPLQLLLE